MIDNNSILLVTATLRTDNLPYIAKNIVERFSGQTKYTPVWIICLDQYNADISPLKIKKLEVYLLEHNIQYQVYYQGQPDTKNYGGALMNAPLQDIKNRFASECNPWVYVLDDDNVISRNFLRFLDEYTTDTDNVWMMNMLDEFGSHVFSRNADKLASRPGSGINKGYSVIHPCAACDPSLLLIRLDKFLEVGGFASNAMYDFDFMTKILRNKGHLNDDMKTQGTKPWLRNAEEYYISCYHNGLVKPDDISSAVAELDYDTMNDSYLRVHTKNRTFNVELSNKEVQEILLKKIDNEKDKTE